MDTAVSSEPASGFQIETMDKPIPPIVLKRRRRIKWLTASGVLLLLAVFTMELSRLKPAAPVVDKSSVWMGTVQRGEMLLRVRGEGTLVPQDIRWITTANAGVIERILILPGTAVAPDTVLVELSDPELEQNAFQTESQLAGAQADLTNLQVQLASQKLTQEAAVASAQADYTTARMESDTDNELGKIGLAAKLDVEEANTKTDELAKLLKIQQANLELSGTAAKAQLSSQEQKIAQLRGLLDLQRSQIDGLKIRAGMSGVLQQLGDTATTLQVGQQLAAGAAVAQVASQTKLKAAIQVAETQARDIQLDQPAQIDTHNGIIPGRVIRIDPSVQNGTVTVDVALEGPLLKGARPDLSVDGTIQLEKLEDVLYVDRPVAGQPNSTAGLFKLVDGGRAAIKVPVEVGRASVSTVEVLKGLQAGDRVILSDMSQWDSYNRVRIQ
ncbi:MAG TPA: HlyD family efflux transporter periplasmic adaptor subunit [Verrucomicrobiae bacterium]|jgi:HlyD family secretion protein|nr:HlyD family efflux transporter periplasmic adaptor subunit [Verrucomicrobiae bacterium]